MDQTQWNALNQLIARQAGANKKGDIAGTSYITSDEQQYTTIPVDQALYAFDGQGSTADVSGQYTVQLSGNNSADAQVANISYAAPNENTQFQVKTGSRIPSRQSSANPLNGATRQSVETNVVKSLLTGQQYVQSNKSHQLQRGSTNPSTSKSIGSQLPSANYATVNRSQQNASLVLQHDWQQQQQNDLDASGLVLKHDDMMSHMICSDTLPENVGPGEKVFVFVDGVAYEIVTGANQELIAQPSGDANVPLTTGISLEDLANISAEQETLKLIDYQAPSVADGALADATGCMTNQCHSGLELLQGATIHDGTQALDGQQYIQIQQQQQQSMDGSGALRAATDQNAMQIIIMPADGDARAQKVPCQAGGMDTTVKLGVQDFMLQTGQSLPPELQEMVARGLDLSNCEFVIQDDDEMQQNPCVYLSSSAADASQYQGTISTDLQQLASVMNSSAIFPSTVTSQNGFGDMIQPITVMNDSEVSVSGVNRNDVLALLAEASTAVANQEQHQTVSADQEGLQSRVMTMPMIAPEEEDDGEFAFLVSDPQANREQLMPNLPTRSHPSDAFLKSFLDFIQGNKPETLSSVANSTVVKRPPLPVYDPDLCRRPVQTGRQQSTSKSSDTLSHVGQKVKSAKTPVTMSLVFTDPSGPSLVSVGGDTLGGVSSGAGDSVKQISVTPFIVQKIDGKSVVLPGSELQKYIPKSILKQTKEKWKQQQEMQQHQVHSESPLDAQADRLMKIKLSQIIKRKRKGSDEDSFDDSDIERGAVSYMSDSDSDPAWKPTSEEIWQKKYSHQTAGEVTKPSRGRGRGRGRPRGSGRGGMGRALSNAATGDGASSTTVGYILQVGSDPESGTSAMAANPNDPHNYQKGDFVVERKDAYSCDGFPIWKIEAGRLLQKYDPVKSDIGLVHKSASVYSSWSGDIRTNFKATMVELMNTAGRRFETVKVLNEYMPRPPDESLEQDSMMELFSIYVQNVISQALDSSFFLAVQEQQEEYYLGPLQQIDGLLSEAQQTILSQISWTDKFKFAMEQCPYYKITETIPQTTEEIHCQATLDCNCPAIISVKFFGPVYNQNLLEVTEEIEKSGAESFYIGQATVDRFSVYHALHHFKFLLFKKCQEEVQYLKLNKDKSDEIILGECLQNRIFVQKCLRELKELLEKCSIVITVITKTDEPAAE